MTDHVLFVSCPRGLESVLAAELADLNLQAIAPGEGGVACRGDWSAVYRINLHARSASRVLLQLNHGPIRNEHDVYRLACDTAWPQWFAVTQRFKVHIEGRRAPVKSLEFTALKIKDAVCDVFRQATGSRPDVAKLRPDVRIHAFVDAGSARLLIDTSGEALFKRGYRTDAGEAPLRENLAAGLLLAAGYDSRQPFMDPFCGSGTIAIEAALIASNRAPGLNRSFGFEQLKPFVAEQWQHIRQQALAAVRPAVAPIAGSDLDAALLATARRNAEAAGVGNLIDWRVCDALDSRPNGPHGLLLSNPPYGVRLAEIQTLHALYPQLGSWLKQYFAGWQVGMFTADRAMPKLMRLTPKRKIPLYNGNLDARLFLLEMVAGSNRKPGKEAGQ